MLECSGNDTSFSIALASTKLVGALQNGVPLSVLVRLRDFKAHAHWGKWQPGD